MSRPPITWLKSLSQKSWKKSEHLRVILKKTYLKIWKLQNYWFAGTEMGKNWVPGKSSWYKALY